MKEKSYEQYKKKEGNNDTEKERIEEMNKKG